MLQLRRIEYQRIHIDWLSFASALRPVHIYCDNDCDCGRLKDRFHWFPWFLKWNCVHWNYIEQESIPVGCNRPVASAVPVTSIAARCQLLGWCPQVNRFEQGGHNLSYPGTQGACPVRSNLSWVMITWEPPPPLWIGRHDWKHYLLATSMVSDNDIKCSELNVLICWRVPAKTTFGT